MPKDVMEITEADWQALEASARSYIQANDALREAKYQLQRTAEQEPRLEVVKTFSQVAEYQEIKTRHTAVLALDQVIAKRATTQCKEAMWALYLEIPTGIWIEVDDYRLVSTMHGVQIWRNEMNITQLY